MSDRPIKINRGPQKRSLLPLLGLLAAAVAIALVVAFAWQGMGANNAQAQEPPASTSSTAEARIVSSSQPESSSVPEPPVPDKPVMPEGALPETERVKSEYFDDAVFVGDSITSGIALYGVMDNADVLAETGIHLGSAYDKEVVKQEDGTRITIIDALGKKQYGKVYIMLGGNEVRDEEQELFIQKYGKFIDDVRALQPNAVLYVQSILPVTQGNKYNMDNDRIDTFNVALLALCKEKEVYYLDIAESFKDENGRLPTEASPADGMHFGPDYYQRWFSYLKTHIAGAPPAPPEIPAEEQVVSSAASSERDLTQTVKQGEGT